VIHFLDASAVVKRYVREPGTDVVLTLFRGRRSLSVSRLSAAEVPAALARRARVGDLAREAARTAAARFEADLPSFDIVEVRSRVVSLAAELVWQADLRAYDAVQLACALHLSDSGGVPVTFVAADGSLLTAARARKLKTLRVG
jgi:predicted nucleic acid-binding protein